MKDLTVVENISLELSGDQALILFDWLVRTRSETQPVEFDDQAEQRVLWDLEALLESRLVEPLAENYGDLLEAARSRVRDRDLD